VVKDPDQHMGKLKVFVKRGHGTEEMTLAEKKTKRRVSQGYRKQEISRGQKKKF